MHVPVRRLVVLLGTAALTAGLLTPVAGGPPGRSMGSGSMQSMRPSGMRGMPSMGQTSLTGGVRMNSNMMMGAGRASSSPSGTASAGQGGSSSRSPGNGGYGSQSQPTNTPSQANGSGDAYAPSSESPSGGSSQQTAARDSFAALRLSGGGLEWPVALRYLTRDDEWQELRERIDARVEWLLSKQAANSNSEDFLQGFSGDVDKL